MMPNDPYPAFDTLTQTQLGVLFGVSSHMIGRWLKEVGLRRPDGQPSQKAVDAGIAVLVTLDNGTHPFWAWAKGPTLRILECAGHMPVSPTATTPQPPDTGDGLLGPFCSRHNDTDGGVFEIVDSRGTVAIWCRGERLAGQVAGLLNLCFKTKKWFC